MTANVATLVLEAVAAYLLVLTVHSLRHRAGLGPFYATLGGLTVIMSWVTDLGVRLEVGGLTFLVGSTVFYTAILLGVFVVYVFDGPGPTRTAILTVAGMSVLAPLVAEGLQLQLAMLGDASTGFAIDPSLRINAASVFATVADLLFLAVAWELMGRPGFRFRVWFRTYLTLLGVMCLDVVLFSTAAFAGTGDYLGIMSGTLTTRVIVASLVSPLLYAYLTWENNRQGTTIESRPVLAIFQEAEQARAELRVARQEIERRRIAEAELEHHRRHLEEVVQERTKDLLQTNRDLEKANDAKREFLANMSHELRTPLNSIIGFSGTLAQGLAGPLNDEQQRQAEMVNNSGRYLFSMIEDVLAYSRIGSGETTVASEEFAPCSLLEEVVRLLRARAEEKDLELEVACADDGLLVRSDRAKVKQILFSLVGNAIKFTDGGRIDVRCQAGEGGAVVFSVGDTGLGIAEKDQPRVFEAFTQIDIPGTAKSQGTGVGLALARIYAEMLDGDIRLSSTPGVGSTFTFTLPDRS